MNDFAIEDKQHFKKSFHELNLNEIFSIFKPFMAQIILLPIFFAATVYLLSDFLPKVYKSTIVIHEKPGAIGVGVPYQELNGAFIAELFKLDSVLDESIIQLKKEDSTSNLNRNLLLQKISTIVARNEKLVFISIKDKSPEQAQRVADTLLRIVMTRTKPTGLDKDRLEKKVTETKEQVEQINIYVKSQMNGLSRSKENNAAAVSAIATLDRIMEMKARYEAKVDLYENVLRGLSIEDLIQAPVISKTSVSPNRKFLMLISWVTSLIGCVLLFYFRNSGKVSAVAGYGH